MDTQEVLNHHQPTSTIFDNLKELNRFGLCNGMDFTGLSVSKMLTILDGLLRRIFLEASSYKASSVKWQATYMLCFHHCTVEQDSHSEQAIFDMIVTIMKEEGARIDSILIASRDIARYFTPELRVHLLLVIWVLNSVGGSVLRIPVEIKLKIFLHSMDFYSMSNMRRKKSGCEAVLGACSYLSRFWVPKQSNMNPGLRSGKSKVCWGDELIMQVLPDIFAESSEHDATCDAFILDADEMLVYCKHAGSVSSVVAMHASSCGHNNPIVLPKRLSCPTLVRTIAKFCLVHSETLGVNIKLEQFLEFQDNKVDPAVLFELIEISSYLDIGVLLDLACAKVASLINGKSSEEIRNTFNMK